MDNEGLVVLAMFMTVAGVAMTLVGFFMWGGPWAALAALGLLLVLFGIPLFVTASIAVQAGH
jgi:hypothetical protein